MWEGYKNELSNDSAHVNKYKEESGKCHKTNAVKMLVGIGEDIGNETLTHCQWEHTMVLPLRGKIWQYLTHKPYDSAIPFLDIHSRASLTHLLRGKLKNISLSTICEKWKQTNVSHGGIKI